MVYQISPEQVKYCEHYRWFKGPRSGFEGGVLICGKNCIYLIFNQIFKFIQIFIFIFCFWQEFCI